MSLFIEQLYRSDLYLLVLFIVGNFTSTYFFNGNKDNHNLEYPGVPKTTKKANMAQSP